MRSWTVLIVDDEPKDRKLLETLLQAEGYTTVSAASGPEALAAMAAHLPDLVMLDVIMPGMDGYQVAVTLKSQPATANVPIIMVSAHNERDARLAGLAAGAEDYICKPIDRAELYLRARNLIRLKGLSDTLNAERRAFEQEVETRTADLQQLAHYDVLTGLPNRVLFHRKLTAELESTDEPPAAHPLGVLSVDIDHFKVVNDSLGHAMGDQLLIEVADRLLGCVEPIDTVGRLGDDEFAVILVLDAHRDITSVAAAVRAALSRPLELGGQPVILTASIGISLYPGDATTAETLIQYSHTAMYRAKASGRDQFRLFTPQMSTDLLTRLELEAALRHAVDHDEFVLHYQPQVDLRTGQVTGVEALLRWLRPGHGLISPAEFVPVLESTGLIVQVGSWVLGEATAQIGRWLRSAVGRMPVAVNVSGRQFVDGDIDAEVAAAIALNRIPPDLLELEITEGTLMEHTERTAESLTRLRDRGVRVSVDDFGTGYSSLAYLRRFPINTLKIDRAFVQEITTNADDAAIALTIIRLAHGLDLNVVAEGVETAAQVAFLGEHGCDQMQGFFFSRPLPLTELEALLSAGTCLYTNDLARPSVDAAAVASGPATDSTARDLLADASVVNVLESLQWSGASVHTVASALNRAGTMAPSGLRWTAKSVRQHVADAAPQVLAGTPTLRRHDVHVYRDDTDLVQRVSVYLAKALHQGAFCIVIATNAHRGMLRRALVDLGLTTTIQGRRYAEHDADTLLATFMRDRVPVAELFEAAITPFLDASDDGGPPVHAYGEMVDILWRAGNVTGAIQLEDLWNALLARRGFTLLCAYAADELHAHAESHDHVAGMRTRHTDLTGTFPTPLAR
jgi:diguanylate cyclase (GGDEF)-like protein